MVICSNLWPSAAEARQLRIARLRSTDRIATTAWASSSNAARRTEAKPAHERSALAQLLPRKQATPRVTSAMARHCRAASTRHTCVA